MDESSELNRATLVKDPEANLIDFIIYPHMNHGCASNGNLTQLACRIALRGKSHEYATCTDLAGHWMRTALLRAGRWAEAIKASSKAVGDDARRLPTHRHIER
jgi:hypothetical protein